jgi:diaminopimelate decarboxylase
VDEEQAEEILGLAAAQPALRIRGLHIYAGSNTLSAEAAAENLANCLRIFEWLAPLAGPDFSTAIVGAGFGIPYADGDTPLDLEAAAAIVNPAVDAMRSRGVLDGVDLMLELGRYLVGPAGYFLTSVIDVKTSRGVRFAICDGGFNAHLAACGMMGSVIRRNWPIEKIGGDLSAPPDVYNLVGPLCTSIDQLASQVRLPALVPGDTIAIASSGAYGLSASPTRFISHPEPHEFLVRQSGGRARVEDVTGAPAGAEA